MKKKSSLVLFVVSAILIISCTEDETPVYPKELKFVESQTLDFKLWVGGAEVSTENVNYEDVFGTKVTQWIQESKEGEEDVIYTFRNDHYLEMDNGDVYSGVKYEIRNDSIFIFLEEEIESFFSIGNLNRITLHSGAYMARIKTEHGSAGSSGLGSNYTLEEILKDLELSGLEDMNEADTIAIMNTMSIFE